MRTIAILTIAAAAAFAGQNDTFLLRNATVYPVSGPSMDNTSVLVVDGKIAEIGPKITYKGKIKIIEGKGLSVYPGMIDSGSPIGLSEIASVRETVDTGELGDFNPQLRAIIAVNPESEHIPVVRANGITSVMVLPGGNSGLVSGQVALMHLSGWTWEQMEIRRGAAMQMRWPTMTGGGRGMGGGGGMRGQAPPSFTEIRRQHDLQVKNIQEFFEQARRYRTAKMAKEPSLKPDLKFEAMIPVLEGKLPLVITAVREREIREAVTWADKEQLKIVLAGVRRPGKMTEEIAKKKIPVILGTTFATPLEDDDPYDEPFALPSQLAKAGVKIAFASFGTQFARNLPYEAAQAVAFGLPYDQALRSLTLNAAEIWGVADQYGSIEKGKYADLIVTDGDPLEVRTQVKMMFIKGEAVDLESKHTKLYKKYMARP